jgi:hypothetical protein
MAMQVSTDVFDIERAYEKPKDPLLNSEANPEVIYRDLPAAYTFGWDADALANALQMHNQGTFTGSALLTDALLGDPRVQATLLARTQALFGRKVRFKEGKGPKAKACLEAWEALWPRIGVMSTLSEIMRWSVMMGFAHAEITWDTSGDVWCPILKPWNPQFEWFHITSRQYVAVTYDGLIAVTPGDGKWFQSSPHGSYRAWLHGAVRPVAIPWITRQYALRDFARFCEVHGLPIVKAKVPAVGDPIQKQRFASSLRSLGSESVVMLPQGIDGITASYDLELLEAKDTSWQAFPSILATCDMSIILPILGENLTTEIGGTTGGSFGAAKAHGDVKESVLEGDNASFRNDFYTCVARPFALYNFGDADAAPITDYDVDSIVDQAKLGAALQAFGSACAELSRAGVKYDPGALAAALRIPGVPAQDTPTPPAVSPGAPGNIGGGPKMMALGEALAQICALMPDATVRQILGVIGATAP